MAAMVNGSDGKWQQHQMAMVANGSNIKLAMAANGSSGKCQQRQMAVAAAVINPVAILL